MSNYNIDLKEEFRKTFFLNVNLGTQAAVTRLLGLHLPSTIDVIPTEKELSNYSRQGVPVWDFVRLLPKKIAGTGEQFDGYDFPVECVVDAIMPKKVVETEIFGADGTVEELMGLGDWEITLKGFIINYDSKDYPDDEVRELKRVCSLKDVELEVEGTFLNMLDVNYVSIRDLKLPPAVGYSNMQAFEISARSKIPFLINATNGVSM